MAQMQRVTAKGLRARVVDEMTRDWPRYSPFIEEHLRADYLAGMARSTEYADHPELLALSQVCGVTIHVWGAENTAIISANPDAREPLPILPIVHLAHLAHTFVDRAGQAALVQRQGKGQAGDAAADDGNVHDVFLNRLGWRAQALRRS
jgi:hypothetical protein